MLTILCFSTLLLQQDLSLQVHGLGVPNVCLLQIADDIIMALDPEMAVKSSSEMVNLSHIVVGVMKLYRMIAAFCGCC